MFKFFICYRTRETAVAAATVARVLDEAFGEDSTFLDSKVIKEGDNFVKVINRVLADPAVIVIALIGDRFMENREDEGSRQGDQPVDRVKFEIDTALQRGNIIIPVLIDIAKMPAAKSLPESMRPITELNALPLHAKGLESELSRLVQALEARGIPRVQRQRMEPVAPAQQERRTVGLPVLGLAAGLIFVSSIFAYREVSRLPEGPLPLASAVPALADIARVDEPPSASVLAEPLGADRNDGFERLRLDVTVDTATVPTEAPVVTPAPAATTGLPAIDGPGQKSPPGAEVPGAQAAVPNPAPVDPTPDAVIPQPTPQAAAAPSPDAAPEPVAPVVPLTIPLTECDRLAGHPLAPRSSLPADQNTPGALPWQINDTDAAVTACENAVRIYPAEPIFPLYLARALMGIDEQRVLELIAPAVAANMPLAMWLNGFAVQDGYGPLDPDPVAARQIFSELCSGPTAIGCYGAGSTLDGPERTPEENQGAAVFYTYGCERGHLFSCTYAGIQRASAYPGIERDPLLALRFFETGCANGLGHGLACLRLGNLFADGDDGIERDQAQALVHYSQACRLGDTGACGAQGRILVLGGDGVATDVPRGLELLYGACDGESGWSCGQLGMIYENGWGGVARDDPLSHSYYVRGCDLNQAWTCGVVGRDHVFGRGVDTDVQRGLELLNAACDGRHGWSCLILGNVYRDGVDGIVTNDQTAVGYYRRGCELEAAAACGGEGEMLVYGGEGVAQDVPSGLELLNSACDRENGWSCRQLGRIYQYGVSGVERDVEAALRFYHRGCELRDARACVEEGLMHFYDYEGITRDLPRALELLERECDNSFGPACKSLGLLYIGNSNALATDYQTAFGYFRRGCDLEDTQACYHEGEMLVNGTGVVADIPRGLELLDQACDGREWIACQTLGEIYRTGVADVVPDHLLANDYYTRGCELNINESCAFRGYYMVRDEERTDQDLLAGVNLITENCQPYLCNFFPRLLAHDWRQRGMLDYGLVLAVAKLVLHDLRLGNDYFVSHQTPDEDIWFLLEPLFVIEIQRLLQGAGVYSGDTDGIIGSETEAAMRALCSC